MGRIRLLGPDLVNRIAAGEVIERPASVVKELVENALDAGAREIDIDVEEGGRRLVRVADDGQGIERDDLPLAFAPHATSKLAGPDDLARIATFGFRGEALASLASVARVRAVSRATGADEGCEVVVEGGRMGDARPVGAKPGTVIEVRDLFGNVPARRKFLKGPDIEHEHVQEAVARFAVSHPEVGFRLSHGGRVEFALPPGQSVRDRIAQFFGPDLAGALLEARGEPPVAFTALLAPPRFSRLNLKGLQVYLNRRFIRDRVLSRAIGEGFREFLPHGRFPVAFLFLDADPAEVDVNVHPTKIEVRFRSVWRVHDRLLEEVRRTLAKSEIAPVIAPERFAQPSPAAPLADVVRLFRGDAGPEATPPMLAMGRRYFQLHRRYLIEEAADGIVIIDQHALHERVLLDELRDQYRRGAIAKQALLVPSVLTLPKGRRRLLEEYRDHLEAVGIEFEDFGPDAVAVRSVPALLTDEDAGRVVGDFLDRAEEAEGSTSGEGLAFSTLEETLAFLACRAAVRFGAKLGEAELERLLSRREELEHAHSCAHGRPVAIRMTLDDLDRLFRRKG